MKETRRLRDAAAELLRRKRATQSLFTFGMSIDIPTVTAEAPEPDETICPAEYLYALHHQKIIGAVQRTINRKNGRALIMAPPGSAKSTYCSVVLPPFVIARKPKFPFILTTYASELAWRQSKRAMQIVRQPRFRALAWPYPEPLDFVTEAAANWELNNGSSCLAAGLTAGLTGNRAGGFVVDDPVAGAEEADSETNRNKVWEAYNRDLLTRITPDAWGIIIMTRWHEDDLAGRILPDDWAGQSGLILCKDGLLWEVVNIPAKAEHTDDPLGRAPGEYLWPEYFPPTHWQIFENAVGPTAARMWSSLYQQRPTPQGAGLFRKESFNWYDKDELPTRLAKTGAGDYAVTDRGGDFTELGIIGLDENSGMWFLDWWYGQTSSDIWIDQTLDMCAAHGVQTFFNEGGVIDKSTRPAFNKRMRERQKYVNIISLPSMQDKVAKIQAFAARVAAGTVWLPRWQPWAHRLVELLCAFPAGRHDDGPDVCGLLGRAIDQMPLGPTAAPARQKGLVPFTEEWLMYEEKRDETPRYR